MGSFHLKKGNFGETQNMGNY